MTLPVNANHGHQSEADALEERRKAWVGDLFIDGFAFCGSGFISMFVGFAYILGIFKESAKLAKSREVSLPILMPQKHELHIITHPSDATRTIPPAPTPCLQSS